MIWTGFEIEVTARVSDRSWDLGQDGALLGQPVEGERYTGDAVQALQPAGLNRRHEQAGRPDSRVCVEAVGDELETALEI